MAKTKNVCLVIGAGEDTGGAISRAFAVDGYHVCMTRRPRNLETLEVQAKEICDKGGSASAHGVDARDEAAMADFIEKIEKDVGPIEELPRRRLVYFAKFGRWRHMGDS